MSNWDWIQYVLDVRNKISFIKVQARIVSQIRTTENISSSEILLQLQVMLRPRTNDVDTGYL